MFTFSLEGHKLVALCSEYPKYRKFLVMRAAQRRNYFRKVLDEIQHRLELDQKMQRLQNPANLDNSREDASISDDLFPDHVLQ